MHLTLDLAGQARFGPDVEWIGAPDYTVSTARLPDFYRAIRTYWNGLADGQLRPDYAGVRPKIYAPDQPAADFDIAGPAAHGLAGLCACSASNRPGSLRRWRSARSLQGSWSDRRRAPAMCVDGRLSYDGLCVGGTAVSGG